RGGGDLGRARAATADRPSTPQAAGAPRRTVPSLLRLSRHRVHAARDRSHSPLRPAPRPPELCHDGRAAGLLLGAGLGRAASSRLPIDDPRTLRIAIGALAAIAFAYTLGLPTLFDQVAASRLRSAWPSHSRCS